MYSRSVAVVEIFYREQAILESGSGGLVINVLASQHTARLPISTYDIMLYNAPSTLVPVVTTKSASGRRGNNRQPRLPLFMFCTACLLLVLFIVIMQCVCVRLYIFFFHPASHRYGR